MPFDPFSQLAGQAVKVGTDIWTAIMLSVWNVGLLLMRFVLGEFFVKGACKLAFHIRL